MNIDTFTLLTGIISSWTIISTVIICFYKDKRSDFDFEEKHIYIGDIFIGMICLPITLLFLICVFINKLIHIEIK